MKNKRYIPGAIGCFIALMLLIGLVFGTKLILETNARLDSMELKQEQLQEFVTVKAIDLVDLKILLDEQDILNSSFNKRIHANFNHTNDNYSDILENHMRIDEVSYEGLLLIIEELEKEIELLKKVK